MLARTITESVVSRCVNVRTFFKLCFYSFEQNVWSNTTGELCRAPRFNLKKKQKCTKWNRLRAEGVWSLEDPELWSPQGENQTFLLSFLCFTDRVVLFSYLIFQVFLWLPVSMRPHYLSWSTAAKSQQINEQSLVFFPGLVWHKNHSTWDVSLCFMCFFFEGLIRTESKIWLKKKLFFFVFFTLSWI